MIQPEKYERALEAIHSIMIRARFMAYESGAKDIADLLDAAELLPEYVAAEGDMTHEFREMLAGVAQTDRGCTHVLERFDGTATARKS